MRLSRVLALATAGTGAGAGLYLGEVTGTLTVDLGLGRRIRPLRPIEIVILAPRQVVYDAAAAPYAARPTRAMREKVTVLERADGMVLAEHRTPIGGGLTTTTTETVAFDPPGRIGFRLLRGPVPHPQPNPLVRGLARSAQPAQHRLRHQQLHRRRPGLRRRNNPVAGWAMDGSVTGRSRHQPPRTPGVGSRTSRRPVVDQPPLGGPEPA